MGATRDVFDALRLANQKSYIDMYDFSTNPLEIVIPFGGDFFGTAVCNMVSVSKSCTTTGLDEQIDALKAAFDTFLLYESHFWIDTDLFIDDTTTTEAVLSRIGSELIDFGCIYHGKLPSAAIGNLISSIYTDFKARYDDKFRI